MIDRDKLWTSEWCEFVLEVCRQHSHGKSDAQLAELFGGAAVFWRGKVKNILLDREHSPGVEMEMEKTTYIFKDGKYVTANYLYLGVAPECKDDWKTISPGDEIRFVANTRVAIGPISGIRVSIYDSDKEGVLLIGIENARPSGGCS